MAPIDYMVELAEGGIEPPSNLDIPTVQEQELAMSFRFHIRQYLNRRAADWQALGFSETLTDWPSLNARSKFWGDDQRAAFKNWEEVDDPRNPLDRRQGVPERIMLRELLRRVDMMVLYETDSTPWYACTPRSRRPRLTAQTSREPARTSAWSPSTAPTPG